MRPETDPLSLTADERLRELAAILARGLLRLRDGSALTTDRDSICRPGNLSEIAPDCLEVPGESVLNVHTG
jgi:hypothetical protein